MHDHHSHQTRKLSWVIFLNISFTIIEIIGGLLTNSLTILSDALHDFGDSLVLILAWFAEKKAQQKPDQKRTFGYKRISLAAAIITSIVLVAGSMVILTQAIPRLFQPQTVHAEGMIFLAVVGVTFNGAGYFSLKGGHSLSQKAVSWHLLEDVLGWVVVLAGSIIMYFVDAPVIDSIMTIGYSLFILWGVSKNLKESFNILLQGVPGHIDLHHIEQGVLSVPNVVSVHDMHVWSMDGETDVFTGHFVIKDSAMKNAEHIKIAIKQELSQHHIEHSTVELESESACSGIDCASEHH